jgi:predicted flavoprotein YhiN
VTTSTNSIAVIGAGPAGLLAALEAARAGQEVILLEKNERCGRKLSITGGGRGNLTNLNVTPQQYTSHHPDLVTQVLQNTSPNELIDYLAVLGVLTYHTDDGWVYPVSNSAASVTTLLEARVLEAGI